MYPLLTMHQPPGLHAVLRICQPHSGLRAPASAIPSPQNYVPSVICRASLTSSASLVKYHIRRKAVPPVILYPLTLLNFMSAFPDTRPTASFTGVLITPPSISPIQMPASRGQVCALLHPRTGNTSWHIACAQ